MGQAPLITDPTLTSSKLKKRKKNMTCDMWYVTRDPWHEKCDMWWGGHHIDHISLEKYEYLGSS